MLDDWAMRVFHRRSGTGTEEATRYEVLPVWCSVLASLHYCITRDIGLDTSIPSPSQAIDGDHGVVEGAPMRARGHVMGTRVFDRENASEATGLPTLQNEVQHA